MSNEQLFTVSEAADKLRVNKFSIYRWAKRGEIRTIPLGRHIRIPGQEITRIMNSGLRTA